jgi:hypothetical protein
VRPNPDSLDRQLEAVEVTKEVRLEVASEEDLAVV